MPDLIERLFLIVVIVFIVAVLGWSFYLWVEKRSDKIRQGKSGNEEGKPPAAKNRLARVADKVRRTLTGGRSPGE